MEDIRRAFDEVPQQQQEQDQNDIGLQSDDGEEQGATGEEFDE
jgi:hypothetical protein